LCGIFHSSVKQRNVAVICTYMGASGTTSFSSAQIWCLSFLWPSWRSVRPHYRHHPPDHHHTPDIPFSSLQLQRCRVSFPSWVGGCQQSEPAQVTEQGYFSNRRYVHSWDRTIRRWGRRRVAGKDRLCGEGFRTFRIPAG